MSGKRRVIFHFDMDHFFSAVEEREHPGLKDRPVIVGADPKGGTGRGVVSTSNYLARKFGVKSGMPISRAWKLCPDAVYLPVNYELYEKVSNEIMDILRKYADKFEQWGIDEAYLDVTSKVDDYASAESLARRIKDQIYATEKLTCSVGVSSNKLVAKIASARAGQKLESMGIKTVGELARCDPTVLTAAFGEFGKQLYLMSNGVDRNDVQERNGVKSISRELTFQEDSSDYEPILRVLDQLSKEVCEDALKQRLHFKTVTIKVRYANFETHTHSKTLPFITDRLYDVKKGARELVQPYLMQGRRIRLIGVKVSSIVSGEKQRTLVQ